jgi:hypothetical protein
MSRDEQVARTILRTAAAVECMSLEAAEAAVAFERFGAVSAAYFEIVGLDECERLDNLKPGNGTATN